MKKTRIVWLGVVIAMLSIGGAIWIIAPTEPEYAGLSLSEWLDQLDRGGKAQGAAATAIRQIGTNALPRLMELLQARDGWSKEQFIRFFRKQKFVTISIRNERDKWRLANLGFGVLGPAAEPAIPELVKLLESPRHSLRAVSALQQIGAPAVDALVSALMNGNNDVRANAALALTWLEGEARIKAVPAVVEHLDDADLRVRIQCATALGRWKSNRDLVVPALISKLKDPDPLMRSTVTRSLADFDRAAWHSFVDYSEIGTNEMIGYLLENRLLDRVRNTNGKTSR